MFSKGYIRFKKNYSDILEKENLIVRRLAHSSG